MANYYKTRRMDTSASPIELFLSQIPDLVSSFVTAIDRKKEREEDRVYRDKIRAEDIANRDRWRAEDLENQKILNEENGWLQTNKAALTDLRTIYQDQVTEYENLMAKYEQTARKVDNTLKLDQTEAFTQTFAQQVDDATEELRGDIATTQDLIKKQTAMNTQIKSRLDFFTGVASEFASKMDGQKTVIESGEETETGLAIWTQKDFEMMLNEIYNDDAFKAKWSEHIDQDYAIHFKEQESSPSHQTLRKLNDDIYKHEAEKMRYNQLKRTEEVESLGHALGTQDKMVQVRYITEELKNLNQMDLALVGLPGFKDTWNIHLGNMKIYNTDMAQLPNYLSSQESIDLLKEEAIETGFMPKEKSDQWSRDKAEKYLEWKYTTKLAQSSGIAMLAGTDAIKNAYISETMTNSAFMQATINAATQFDAYLVADENTKLQMEMMWARRLGLDVDPKMQEVVSHKDFGQGPKWQITVRMQLKNSQKELQSLLGTAKDADGSELDIKDTAYFKSFELLQQTEYQLQYLTNLDPNTFKTTIEHLKTNPTGLFNNNSDLKSSLNTLSCGQGEFFDNALGICLPQDQDLESTGIVNERKKHNAKVSKTQLPGEYLVDPLTGEITKRFKRRGSGRMY